MEERQCVHIHDILNAQGFAMHYRVISKMGAILKFSDVGEECSQSSQQKKGWIYSVLP